MYKLQNGELQQLIEEQIINPYIADEIKKMFKLREQWITISNIMETLGNVFIVISTIFAFAGGYYENLSFVAGCINITSIMLIHFGSYAGKKSSEKNDAINMILSRVNIHSVPNARIINRLNVSPEIEIY